MRPSAPNARETSLDSCTARDAANPDGGCEHSGARCTVQQQLRNLFGDGNGGIRPELVDPIRHWR